MGGACSLVANEPLTQRGVHSASLNNEPEEREMSHRNRSVRSRSEHFLWKPSTGMHNDMGCDGWPTAPVKEGLESCFMKEREKGNNGEFLFDVRLSELRLKYLYMGSFCKADGQPYSLMELCKRCICMNLHSFEDVLMHLPRHILQELLDCLEGHDALNLVTFSAFKGCRLKRVNLRRCNNVNDVWLTSMTSSSLRCLDLASCSQITDTGLSQVIFSVNEVLEDLECLNVSNCYGLKCGREIVAALASLESAKTKPSLKELNLSFVAGVDDCCCQENLPKLQALRSLELKGCEISDSALLGISSLSCLQFLCLRQCHYLTAAGLEVVASLKHLKSLDIGWCQGLSMVASNDWQGQPVSDGRALVDAVSSSEIDIDKQYEASLSVLLSGLSKLEKLSVARTRIGGASLADIARLSLLRELSLLGCERVTNTGIEAIMTECKSLQLLDISGCRQVTRLPRGIFDKLRCLRLSGTMINDDHVRLFGTAPPAEIQLPALMDLNMDYCHVGNSAMKALAQLGSSLETLSLADLKSLTDAGIVSLATGLPKLSSLNLASCYMSSAGIAALSKCSFLHTLNADCSEIGDTDLQLICTALPSLTSLNFFSARITDAGMLRALPQMTNLVKLELCGGLISDKGVAALENLVSLESLNLRENSNITSLGIAYLGNLTRLSHLNLSHTSVTGSAAVHMAHLFRLRTLCVFGCSFEEDVIAWLMETLPCIRLIKRDHPPEQRMGGQLSRFFQFRIT